jgi:glycosyltransferase involved in cell wall biosynthesis
MPLFFIYPGSKGSGLESTLAPFELAKELGIDSRLFLSKDNERRGLVSKLYPEAEFYNFLSPSDISKMRKKIGNAWTFFTMISPKMIPLYFSIRKRKLFYFHATYETAFSKPGLGGWMMEKFHDLVIKDATLTLANHAHLVWEIMVRLKKEADVLPHPPFIMRSGFFAVETKFDLPFRKYFLYFGDVNREGKGVAVLTKALELHPEFNAIIAGRGGDLPKLQNLAHLKGWIGEGELHYLIKNANATVLPYLVTAPFSGCMALSFHFRTPVIGSDLPTFQGAVEENQTGWLFPSGDYRALGEKMQEVWEGKRTYSKEAIEKKEKEMWGTSKKRFREILEKIGCKD